MRTPSRPCWAILALALSALSVRAQAPQNAPPPPPPPPAQAAPAPSAPPQAAPVQAAPAPANAVVATVNGQPILETAVQRGLMRVPPQKHAEFRPQIINFLIDQMLIDQHLLQLGIQIDAKEVEKRIEEIKAELKKSNQEFSKMLAEAKLTEAELRAHITADLRWEKFAEQRATDKVLKELFDGQKYLFDGSQVHARHILLSPPAGDAAAGDKAKADLQAVKQQIEKKVAEDMAKLPATTDNLTREKERLRLTEEAFGAVAKEKSACPSKANGGDVGWFQGAGIMVEPFARAAFALQPAQMSDVVKTQFGYHLILVTERKPGRDVKFEDAKETIKEYYCTGLHESISAQERQKSTIKMK